MKEIKLRDYQKSDIERIKSAWTEYNSILYQLPTGGGKSVVISKIIADRKDQKILVFAHKRRLLTQLKQHLLNVGVKAGLLIASTEENLDSNVVIVSIRTAVKDARSDKLLERDWDLIVIDEARNSRTNSYDKVLKAIEEKNLNLKKIGVDATPYRKDKKRLDEHFEYMVCSTETTASLIEKGFLAKYKTYVAPIGEIEKEVDEVANDFQQQQLSHYMRQVIYMNYVVEMYKQYGDNRQTIVFAVDKEHARSLKKVFVERGVKYVEQIDSSLSTEEIERITKSYEEKETQILINVEMLTEGVDLPDTGVVIGARPTKSLTLYLQMVGRGTRLKGDGSHLIVLDCCGWTEAFGQLSSPKHWSLNPEIDPNNPRLNNRVVGKRENGTIEEDLSEFIGEVIELTPEEYLNSVQNGLEKATKLNEKIDENKLTLFEKIYELWKNSVKSKLSECCYTIDNRSRRYTEYTITLFDINKKESKESDWQRFRVIVKFSLERRLYSLFEGPNEPGDEGRIVELMRMSQVFAELNNMFLTQPKVEVQTLELYEQILDLEKTKIDLKAIQNKAKEFNEEQWRESVKDHFVANNGLFVLNQPQRRDNYFKGYNNDYIVSFKVTGSSINSYNNTLEISLENRFNRDRVSTETKSYIKAEKIYEILKAGKWNEKVEK